MAAHQHVWGPWTDFSVSQQRRQCIRGKEYQYRSYPTTPGL